MVGQVYGVVAPEIRLLTHPLNHFMHSPELMVTQGPDAYGTATRAECQVTTIRRVLHLLDVEDGVDLCSNTASAQLVHQDCCSAQVTLIDTNRAEVFSTSLSEVACVARRERRHSDDDVETGGINEAALCVQRHIDGASKFAGVDAEDIDLTARGGHEDVVFARVNLEASDAAFINEELCKWCH